jgi:hypothetical protein
MNLKQFKTSPKLENGAWIKFDEEGCEFFLAPRTRPQFNDAYERAIKKTTGFKRDTPAAHRAATKAAVVEACILDWKGVMDGDTPVPCTPESKKAIVEIPAIYEWLIVAVTEITNFQEEAIAEDAEALKSGPGVGA